MCSCLYLNAQEQLASSTEIEEQKEPCLQTITGEVRDEITNELIPNTIVSLTDNDGNPVQTLMVTEDATFTFRIACQNTYKLTASKESYNPQSKTFTTSSSSGIELKTKIFLDQGRIDFITDPVEKTTANDVASVNSETGLQAVAIDKISTSKIPAKEEDKEIVEESAEVKKPVTEKPVVTSKRTTKTAKTNPEEDVLVLKPVIFDYESSYLNQQAKNDLLRVVAVMKKNPKLIIECASYTDAKGSEKYNLWMSQRRAKRTVDYIIRRGVDPRRISGKGYGESKLINDCTEGDDCTDEQRAVNRRTEFKIVKK